MESNESLADLLGEVHNNIAMLQKAITEVGRVKASVKMTASDLKSQIRDSISRHLEALRNRETWLLGQVEVVQHVKEDVLRQQQSELNKALGRLQTTCVLLEQSTEVLDTDSLESHVRESLTAVSGINFTPEETNIINFVAQNFELQEFIQKFGVVVSDDPVVDKQIVAPFQVLRFGKKNDFFTPSGPCEEWLMKTNGTSSSEDNLNFPSVELDTQDWLQQKAVSGVSTPESSVSCPEQHPIEHWLSKGQSKKPGNGLETPEDKGDNVDSDKDEAMVKNKTSENQGWLLGSSRLTASAVMPSNLFNYYRVVKLSESSQWLKNSGITEDELSTNLIGETYRNIASSSADEWLKKKVQSTGSTKFSTSMSTQSCSGITEDELPTNLIGETYRNIASSSADEWLKKKVQSTGSTKFSRSMSTQSCSDCSCGLTSACSDSRSDLQEKSMEFDDTLSDISDWLAVGKEDTDTRSGIMAPSNFISCEVPDNDRWLFKQSDEINITAQDYTGIKNYKENLAAQSNQHWLRPCSENVSDNREAKELTTSGMKSYIESLPVDSNHWLSNPSKDKGICKWLARSSSERCKNCPIMCSKGVFKVFDQIASSKDGWLLTQELY